MLCSFVETKYMPTSPGTAGIAVVLILGGGWALLGGLPVIAAGVAVVAVSVLVTGIPAPATNFQKEEEVSKITGIPGNLWDRFLRGEVGREELSGIAARWPQLERLLQEFDAEQAKNSVWEIGGGRDTGGSQAPLPRDAKECPFT